MQHLFHKADPSRGQTPSATNTSITSIHRSHGSRHASQRLDPRLTSPSGARGGPRSSPATSAANAPSLTTSAKIVAWSPRAPSSRPLLRGQRPAPRRVRPPEMRWPPAARRRAPARTVPARARPETPPTGIPRPSSTSSCDTLTANSTRITIPRPTSPAAAVPPVREHSRPGTEHHPRQRLRDEERSQPQEGPGLHQHPKRERVVTSRGHYRGGPEAVEAGTETASRPPPHPHETPPAPRQHISDISVPY